jgi:hypothetical protein
MRHPTAERQSKYVAPDALPLMTADTRLVIRLASAGQSKYRYASPSHDSHSASMFSAPIVPCWRIAGSRSRKKAQPEEERRRAPVDPAPVAVRSGRGSF